MAVICPTITAYNREEYKNQIEKVVHLAHRIQIDLTDGQFTQEKTVGPDEAWWPVGFMADFHLMYRNPLPAVQLILLHKPNLIVVHAEAEGRFEDIAVLCNRAGVKLGAALLKETPVESITPVLGQLSHVLIFSGNLGYQGGSHAELNLLSKVNAVKAVRPDIEVGWDGGVNDQNITELIMGGVDVLNVGGYLQNAQNIEKSFHSLQRIADETGTT